MLALRPSPQPPSGMPHLMIPSTVAHVTTIGQHPILPVNAIVHKALASMAVPPTVAPAAPAVVAPGGLEGPGAGATGEPHVQFRNKPAAPADLRSSIEELPLIRSSKNRIKAAETVSPVHFIEAGV